MGFVLALQMYYALVTYGAAESLGLIVNLALVRELGPVVTGLLFAGRAGTSLTAEIGLMKAGEQLAAMEMMAVDTAPACWRAAAGWAGLNALLAVLFSAVGILGAYVVAVLLIGVDAGNFWSISADACGCMARCGQTGWSRPACSACCARWWRSTRAMKPTPRPRGVPCLRPPARWSFLPFGRAPDFVLTALMFSTP